MSSDLRTLGYVLRRTNFGEADRILNLITPEGKISAIARGVRKEKSKLAGGIEMFSLIDINIHHGRGDLAVVTGAKMLKYHSNLVTDLAKMELAGMILKKISLAAEHTDNPEFFTIVDQTLSALQAGAASDLVEAWFWLRLAKASGEEVNLYFDTDGEKLSEDEKYSWGMVESALSKNPTGMISTNEIKMMRLLLTADLLVAMRVKTDVKMSEILHIARSVNKLKYDKLEKRSGNGGKI